MMSRLFSAPGASTARTGETLCGSITFDSTAQTSRRRCKRHGVGMRDAEVKAAHERFFRRGSSFPDLSPLGRELRKPLFNQALSALCPPDHLAPRPQPGELLPRQNGGNRVPMAAAH